MQSGILETAISICPVSAIHDEKKTIEETNLF